MNIQEEKRVCFDVDQNKQKINFLLKKNKENETQQTELNQKLATVQSDINSLSSAVETLQNSTPTEEKIELLSYDIYRNRDIMYRNNKWEPSSIFFLCDTGAKFKLHIWFTLIGTYPVGSGDASVTTTITLDGEEIYSKTYDFSGPFTDDIEYTGFFTSKKKSHKLIIKAISTKEEARQSYYIMPDIINVELWGTNILFVTRKNDFHISPTNTKNIMTTTCIDQKARLSMQPADENLSLDSTNFRTVVYNRYNKQLNQIRPYAYHYMSQTAPIYNEENPSIMLHFYAYTQAFQRAGYLLEMESTETAEQYPTQYYGGAELITIGLSNQLTDDKTKLPVVIKHQSNLTYTPEYNKYFVQFSQPEDLEIIDINSPIRLDDFSHETPIVCIVTRENATNYLFECVNEAKTNPQIYELGFGTNINAYSTAQGFKIYMRVGQNTKVLLVKKNLTTNAYEIVSSNIINNIQEFWHGANGTRFERVGDNINYYLSGETTPTSSLKLDI